MAKTGFARGDADLTECAREPIHVPGAIQPHGVLLELRGHDLTIVRVSANAPEVLGLEFDHLLGRPLAQFVGTDQLRRLEAALRLGDVSAANPTAVTFLAAPGETFDAILQLSEGFILLELEPRSLGGEGRGLGPTVTLRGALARLQSAASLDALYEAIVEEIRRLTGFDRVTLYRFDADWNGQVIAEAKAEDQDAYLGLHYPASDIPAQARELYTRCYHRLIPDASYQPAAILGGDGRSDPLDMSHCVLRSVSPVHLEYMRNMGVAASLTISLLHGGRLWGLIACHHRSRRFLPYTTRQDCEILGRLAAAQIETRDATDSTLYRGERIAMRGKFLEPISTRDHFGDALTEHSPNLLDYVPASGVAVLFEDQCATAGEAPDSTGLNDLRRWLLSEVDTPVFHTEALFSVYGPAIAWKSYASGLLAVEFDRERGGYAFWFRPEVVRTVTWGATPPSPSGSKASRPASAPGSPSISGSRSSMGSRCPGRGGRWTARWRYATFW